MPTLFQIIGRKQPVKKLRLLKLSWCLTESKKCWHTAFSPVFLGIYKESSRCHLNAQGFCNLSSNSQRQLAKEQFCRVHCSVIQKISRCCDQDPLFRPGTDFNPQRFPGVTVPVRLSTPLQVTSYLIELFGGARVSKVVPCPEQL